MSGEEGVFLIDGGVVHDDNGHGSVRDADSDKLYAAGSAPVRSFAANDDFAHSHPAPASAAVSHDLNQKDGDDSAERASANAPQPPSVHDLIPLCVQQHASESKLSAAVFGYDIAQMEKRPWNEPGAKLSDYFNYGFNERTWRLYCLMQKDGPDSLRARADEVLRSLEQRAGVEEMRGMHNALAMRHGERPSEYVETDTSQRYGYGTNTRRHNYHSNDNNNGHADLDNYANNSGVRAGAGGRNYNNSGSYNTSAAARPLVQNAHHSSYKTRLCQRFMEGRCARGAECNYAHGVDELRTMPAAANSNSNNNNNFHGHANDNYSNANHNVSSVSHSMPGFTGGPATAYPDSAAMNSYLGHAASSAGMQNEYRHSAAIPGSYPVNDNPHTNNNAYNNYNHYNTNDSNQYISDMYYQPMGHNPVPQTGQRNEGGAEMG